MVTDFTLHDLQAGRAFHIELERFTKAVSFPICQGFRVLPVIAGGNEGIPYPQSRRHVLHKRWKEIVSSGGRSPNHDGSKSFVRQVPVSNVMHQPDDTNYVSICVKLGSESAGFPNVMSSCRMFWHENIGDLHDFPA